MRICWKKGGKRDFKRDREECGDESMDEFLKGILLTQCEFVGKLAYTCEAETYLIFQLVSIKGARFADDGMLGEEYTYKIYLYAKADYTAALEGIKEALLSAQWYDTEVQTEEYEPETGYYHVPILAHFMKEKES